jgi:5-methylthioadenosine/S-adenosylhomocysteine deaminase
MQQHVDLLIHAKWVIPVEPDGCTLHNHSVAVKDGRIVALLPQHEARNRFVSKVTHSLEDHILIPGFVNLHTHAAMTLMRGIADDLPLMRWLQEAIWPAEAKHVDHAFVRDGTLLAAREMLLGGTTTCNEMYFHPAAAAEAFDLAGMRATVGVTVIDFPTPYAATADEYFAKGLAAHDQWRGHPLLRFSIAPHAPYTTSDTTLSTCASLAAELDIPIHVHVQETAQEVTDALAKDGIRPIERLARLGLVNPSLIAVHAVHLTESEIELLARHGANVAHCPTSNMKLASGAAPVARMLDHGLNVGLGTDGAASNNRLDMFHEMRHAALLAKLSTGAAEALPAHQALRLGTLGGATALGMAAELGSIEPGKLADLCAVELSGFVTQPCYNPVSHLVFVCGREHVSHVWVNGEPRVADGRLLQTSNTDMLNRCLIWQNRLSGY